MWFRFSVNLIKLYKLRGSEKHYDDFQRIFSLLTFIEDKKPTDFSINLPYMFEGQVAKQYLRSVLKGS